MKIFMYNLSDEIFMESIIYLQNYSLDYFEIIRSNMDRFDVSVLEVPYNFNINDFVIEFPFFLASGKAT